MQTSMQHLHGVGDVARSDRARRIVHRHRMTAAALIGFMTALAVVLIATLGLDIAPIVVATIAVAFPLMWMSTDAIAAQES